MGEKSPLVLILAVLAGLAIVGVGIFFIVKYAGNKDSSGDTHIHNNNRTYGGGKVGSRKVYTPTVDGINASRNPNRYSDTSVHYTAPVYEETTTTTVDIPAPTTVMYPASTPSHSRTYGSGRVGGSAPVYEETTTTTVDIPATTTVIHPAPTPSHNRTYGSGRVGGGKSGGLYDPATQGHGASGNPNASRHREAHSDVFDPAKQGQKAAGNPNTGGDGVFRPGAQGRRGAGNPNFGRG